MGTEAGRQERSLETTASLAPRVSVVLATHRIDPFFPAAIASILEQTYRDFEFILVLDKGLRAERIALATEYAHDGRVRFLEAPPLGGLALALNLGIGEARGEYIARMDGDDISLPQRFEEQVRFLDAHPQVAVLGGRLQLIDEHGSNLDIPYKYYGTDRQIRRILPLRNPMPHPALMMRKAALMAVGGYKYGHASEDYELFLRMSRNPEIGFANLDSLVLLYRRHTQQGTNPEYFRRRFAEMGGFMFTEFLRSYSPKYLLGIFGIHPWTRRLRLLLRRS